VPANGWLNRLALAWTVIVATLLWSAVQARWVWTRQLYYAPPPTLAGGTDGAPQPDPEKPASRG
jgi:ATP synthase protein I